MCVCVYAGIISKKRLARIPSSSGASLLGEHCNYSDYYSDYYATLSIEWRSSFPWQERQGSEQEAPAPHAGRLSPLANKPHGPSCTRLQTVKKVISINQFQRETDVSPKISKTWNLHSIIFNHIQSIHTRHLRLVPNHQPLLGLGTCHLDCQRCFHLGRSEDATFFPKKCSVDKVSNPTIFKVVVVAPLTPGTRVAIKRSQGHMSEGLMKQFAAFRAHPDCWPFPYRGPIKVPVKTSSLWQAEGWLVSAKELPVVRHI